MKDKNLDKLLEQLQFYLDSIATLPPDQLARFLHLKKRAARVIRRIKRDYPTLTTLPLREAELSVRREVPPPAEDTK